MNEVQRKERRAEDKLAKELNAIGLWARHIDTSSVNGLPDLLVVGKKAILVEMKYSRDGYDAKLKDIMQPSQPVFEYEIEMAGFRDSYLCVYDGKHYHLYSTEGMISLLLSDRGATVADLQLAAPQFLGARDMALHLKAICNG